MQPVKFQSMHLGDLPTTSMIVIDSTSATAAEAQATNILQCDVILLFYDATNEATLSNAENQWMKVISETRKEVPVILIANKIDELETTTTYDAGDIYKSSTTPPGGTSASGLNQVIIRLLEAHPVHLLSAVPKASANAFSKLRWDLKVLRNPTS